METSFGKWLRERGENPAAYARRKNTGAPTRVALLAGYSREPQEIKQFHLPTLRIIAADTGIPPEKLMHEALEAARNPTPPRRYIRRGEGDGKRTSAAE